MSGGARAEARAWLGPRPSAIEMAATLFAGVTGIMFAGVGPLLLGALEHAGRLSAAQIGQAGMIELLTMGLAAGLTAAQHQVVDVLGVECGHLVESGAHHLRGQVIRPHAHQRALAGPPDRGAGKGNDHGFGHENS